jgi:hypothetical protein
LDSQSLQIDAESVSKSARAAVASLPEAKVEAFKRLLPFFVAEPVLDTLPVSFLSMGDEGSVRGDVLHELAVAGKLVYAHVRWLDDLADEPRPGGPGWSVHALSEALASLARTKFERVLGPSQAAPFLSTLAQLYARYAASLAVDTASQAFSGHLTLDDYVEHAKARAAPIRAPVDAVLLLVGAPEDRTQKARSCFEWCVAGLQLYDDALDVEDDFKEGRLSWVVSATLRALDARGAEDAPDADLLYETALVEGFLARNLAVAEALFQEALSLADSAFPNCVDCLNAMSRHAHEYKSDLEGLVTSAVKRGGVTDG